MSYSDRLREANDRQRAARDELIGELRARAELRALADQLLGAVLIAAREAGPVVLQAVVRGLVEDAFGRRG